MPLEIRPDAFELWFRRVDEKRYGAQLTRAASQAGTVVDFELPIEDEELALIRRRVVEGDCMEYMERVGKTLFEILFDGEMLRALRCCQAALGINSPLHMTLDFTHAPKLAELPWEYLFDPEEREFMLAGGTTTVVRRLGSRARGLAPAPKLPIRMAVVLPVGDEDLGGDEEWEQLEGLLAPHERSGRLRLLRIDADSMAALQDQLKEQSYHILHLIRHGQPDKLLFRSDEGGKGEDVVLSRRLAALLKNQTDLRLVVLNSCHGAQAQLETSIPAMAVELERRGIPAVVAMQFAIPSDLAIRFAVSFYTALVEGQAVDEALATSWRDLYSGTNHPAWGTPVLYASSSGQRLLLQAQWWNPKRKIAALATAALLALGWFAIPDVPQVRELRLHVGKLSANALTDPYQEIVTEKLLALAGHWPQGVGPPPRIVHSGCSSHGQTSWADENAAFYQLQGMEPMRPDSGELRIGLVDGHCRTGDVFEISGIPEILEQPHSASESVADPFPIETRIVEWFVERLGVPIDASMREVIRSAPRANLDARRWNQQGLTLLQAGRFEEARDCFQQAIATDGEFASAFSSLAMAETSLGKIDEAIQHALRATELQPGNGLFHYNLGSLLRRFRRSQTKKAIHHLRSAAEDYEYPDAWNELGVLYLSSEQWAEAQRALTKGLAAQPGNPVVRKNLAWAELEMGNPKDALQHLEGIEKATAHDRVLLLETTYFKARALSQIGNVIEACRRIESFEVLDYEGVTGLYAKAQELKRSIPCVPDGDGLDGTSSSKEENR